MSFYLQRTISVVSGVRLLSHCSESFIQTLVDCFSHSIHCDRWNNVIQSRVARSCWKATLSQNVSGLWGAERGAASARFIKTESRVPKTNQPRNRPVKLALRFKEMNANQLFLQHRLKLKEWKFVLCLPVRNDLFVSRSNDKLMTGLIKTWLEIVQKLNWSCVWSKLKTTIILTSFDLQNTK